MMKCGWEGCSSLFSTGRDMNEHVLVRHIEFLEGNNNLLRMLQQRESLPPPPTPTFTPNFPSSPTSSVGSNQTCVKCRCNLEDFHTPEEAPRGVEPIQVQKQVSLGSAISAKRSSSDQNSSEAKKQKMEAPPQDHPTVPSIPAHPVTVEEEDTPINYSSCSEISQRAQKLSQVCQLMIEKVEKLPEKRFENPSNLEFCLPCFQFKGPCDVTHNHFAEKLKNTWLNHYKEKMEKKRRVLTKKLLIEQLGKIKKHYIADAEKARKSDPSTNLT